MTGLSGHLWFSQLHTLWPHRIELGWVPDLKGKQECQRWYPLKAFNQEELRIQWICGSYGAKGSRGDSALVGTNQRPMSLKSWKNRGYEPGEKATCVCLCVCKRRLVPCPRQKLIMRDSQSHRQSLLVVSHSHKTQICLLNFVSMKFFWALLLNPHFAGASIQL